MLPILVIGVPDSPDVIVANVSSTSIMLVISAPHYTGGFPITNYSITFGNTKLSVGALNDTVNESINGLNPKMLYNFSVRACNDLGHSQATVIPIRTHGEQTC